jgi:hypothetical protein
MITREEHEFILNRNEVVVFHVRVGEILTIRIKVLSITRNQSAVAHTERYA